MTPFGSEKVFLDFPSRYGMTIILYVSYRLQITTENNDQKATKILMSLGSRYVFHGTKINDIESVFLLMMYGSLPRSSNVSTCMVFA